VYGKAPTWGLFLYSRFKIRLHEITLKAATDNAGLAFIPLLNMVFIYAMIDKQVSGNLAFSKK
jgi:hypothetical protein